MAKTKTPLLSLGSSGTIGKALTSQKRGSQTLLRAKPTPAYRRTLSQQYQRWLYEDYAHLWTQQSLATRQSYHALGSRHHLTGFQYWMKYNLKYLPDIAGYWKLDEKSGPTAHDSSRNQNHGTIIGATPADGIIAGALLFDGLNDWVTFPASPTLTSFTAFSIEFFVYLSPFSGSHRGLYYASRFDPSGGIQIILHSITNTFRFYVSNTLGVGANIITPFTPNTFPHYAVTWDGVNIQAYLAGVPIGAPVAFTGIAACTSVNQTIGARIGLYYHNNLIDHFIIHRRSLDPTEILRHSLRRYPS